MGSGILQDAVDVVPLLSVAITAYKAEHTLPQAIDSVLAQRITFPIEIIVSDDCSPDGVREVVRAYQQKSPQKIRLLERDRNVGMQRNYYETFAMCRGEYIAWLDGDDYWTDPDKLTRQVNALEADPSISLCGHYVRWVVRGGTASRQRYPECPAGRYGIEDILRKNFLPSPSIVFRNGIQHDLPPWYFDIAPLADWPVNVLAALSGDILMLDGVMADYTLNPGSACWGKGERYWYERDAAFYELLEPLLPSHRVLIRGEKVKRYEAVSYVLRKQGDLSASRKAAVKAFFASTRSGNVMRGTRFMLGSFVREIAKRVRSADSLSAGEASAGD